MKPDWSALAKPAMYRPVIGSEPITNEEPITRKQLNSLKSDRVIGSKAKNKDFRKKGPNQKKLNGEKEALKETNRSPDHQPQKSGATTQTDKGFGGDRFPALQPITIPLRLSTGQNEREHPLALARRVKRERQAVQFAWLAVRPRIVVHFTRVSPHHTELDDDNNVAACKHIRDEVAAQLGLDDGDKCRIRFVCDQRRGPWATEIRLFFERGEP